MFVLKWWLWCRCSNETETAQMVLETARIGSWQMCIEECSTVGLHLDTRRSYSMHRICTFFFSNLLMRFSWSMKPRCWAEWVVLSEELWMFASCLLRPMSRNSVSEELSVRRFPLTQEAIWVRAFWRRSILEPVRWVEQLSVICLGVMT